MSALILNIGFFMAGLTEKKQALHDKITGCLVVDN
ncbi:putative RDD family membrane protein YckC [Salinibacter ruber]|nr:putative RDD family membrane protein YckC [Salinibacter ruber]